MSDVPFLSLGSNRRDSVEGPADNNLLIFSVQSKNHFVEFGSVSTLWRISVLSAFSKSSLFHFFGISYHYTDEQTLQSNPKAKILQDASTYIL